MSPLRISIDLAQSPLLVGGLLLGKYIIIKGSKGASVIGTNGPKREEIVDAFKDARSVVKSFFGAQNFDAVVVVVPNTSMDHCGVIGGFGQNAGFNITQVITENIAVAEAYVEKARPASETKLAIVSISAGILDVTIISVAVENIGMILHTHKAHDEPIDFEEHKSGGHSGGGVLGVVGGIVGGVVHTLVDPLEKVFNVLKNLLEGLEIGGEKEVEKVILVGKASRSEKVQNLVRETFDGSEIWKGIESEEVAAYGAATISYKDKRLEVLNFDPRIRVEEEAEPSPKGAVWFIGYDGIKWE